MHKIYTSEDIWQNGATYLYPSEFFTDLDWIVEEAPGLLVPALLEVLELCPWLAGALIPLYQEELSLADCELLSQACQEASDLLKAERLASEGIFGELLTEGSI